MYTDYIIIQRYYYSCENTAATVASATIVCRTGTLIIILYWYVVLLKYIQSSSWTAVTILVLFVRYIIMLCIHACYIYESVLYTVHNVRLHKNILYLKCNILLFSPILRTQVVQRLPIYYNNIYTVLLLLLLSFTTIACKHYNIYAGYQPVCIIYYSFIPRY